MKRLLVFALPLLFSIAVPVLAEPAAAKVVTPKEYQAEQEKLRQDWSRMTPEERRAARKELMKHRQQMLDAMTPEQRQQWMAQAKERRQEMMQSMTPEQRQQMQERMQQRRSEMQQGSSDNDDDND